MVDALMQNVHAVHICIWDEYVSSLCAILPWMIAYDNNKYGRWLPDFRVMLTALPLDQVEFLHTDFTQSITGDPYSNLAWEMYTMNERSKMKSGWLSILKNEKQLLVHCRNVNQVTRIRAAHNSLVNRRENSNMWNVAQDGYEEMNSVFTFAYVSLILNGTYRKTQKSKLIQKLFLQPVSLQESYTALVGTYGHDLGDGHSIT